MSGINKNAPANAFINDQKSVCVTEGKIKFLASKGAVCNQFHNYIKCSFAREGTSIGYHSPQKRVGNNFVSLLFNIINCGKKEKVFSSPFAPVNMNDMAERTVSKCPKSMLPFEKILESSGSNSKKSKVFYKAIIDCDRSKDGVCFKLKNTDSGEMSFYASEAAFICVEKV